MRCPKCGNPWSLNNDQWGNVWCQSEPPYHMGCGKKIRLKRTHGRQKRMGMEYPALKVGNRVVFKDLVYAPPFSPHYDEYKEHVFEVLAFYYQNTHVGLRCLDADVPLRGYVHPDELRLADNCWMCLGAKGGVRGNENRVGEFVLCDYCSSEIQK